MIVSASQVFQNLTEMASNLDKFRSFTDFIKPDLWEQKEHKWMFIIRNIGTKGNMQCLILLILLTIMLTKAAWIITN